VANPFIISFQDNNGVRGTGKLWVPDATIDPDVGNGDLLASINAATNAAVTRVAILIDDVVTTVAAVDGVYDLEDKAVLQFLDADGFTTTVVIPAPIEGVFTTDDKTVDDAPGNAIVQALIADILLYCVTRTGAALIEFVKGWRARRQRSQ